MAAMMYRFVRATQRRASRQLGGGSDELQIRHAGGDESQPWLLKKLELCCAKKHNTNNRRRLFIKAGAILEILKIPLGGKRDKRNK